MVANFFFCDSLNDFLPANKRNSWLGYTFHGKSSVKDAIEAIGVPHPEVDVILVHHAPVDFTYQLKDSDLIEVYPISSNGTFPESYSLSKIYMDADGFVLDVHLGKLAKAMRLLGLDTLIDTSYTDQMIAQISETEHRIVLTRDVGLLKHKAIKCGYWIRSQYWEQQLSEVMERFHLRNRLKPFSRCTVCNGKIEEVPKDAVLHSIPPLGKQLFDEFFQCTNCKKVYWKGSHYERMKDWVRSLIRGSAASN